MRACWSIRYSPARRKRSLYWFDVDPHLLFVCGRYQIPHHLFLSLENKKDNVGEFFYLSLQSK